jgi:galactonate dehydratase
MHGRFNPVTAIEMARQLEPFQPGWVEEPVPPEKLPALKKAGRQIRVPLATGERLHTRRECRELFELPAADITQPGIAQFGGMLEATKLAAWPDACSALIVRHNLGGPVSTAAHLHLAACTTSLRIQEHFNHLAEECGKAAAAGNPEVVDGYFALPSGPGLGVVLDHSVVEAHPRRPISCNLFAETWHHRQAEREPAPAAATAD